MKKDKNDNQEKGIVYRMSKNRHQQLREKAFVENKSIQQLIDGAVKSLVVKDDLSLSDNFKSVSDEFLNYCGTTRFKTIMADPPWQFQNRTGKVAPEHHRLKRYSTLSLNEICELPVNFIADETAHLYLWVPNALLPDGLEVMRHWGFQYKSNIIWHKIRKDGGSDGRGVGFYFRNVTEILLFGVKGKNARTLPPGRSQVNMIQSRKREHSRKPDEQYDLIESCSPGPYLEMFSRGTRDGWTNWGNQASEDYTPDWKTYQFNSGQKVNAA